MFQEERRDWLVERARKEGRIEVNQCAELLDVTVETIRRDFTELEKRNLLRRFHGGAVPVEGRAFESSLEGDELHSEVERLAIAKEAIKHMSDAYSVYIDEGQLPLMVAENYFPTHEVTVVTASFPVANALVRRPNIDLIFIGGRVRANKLATADLWGPRMLAEYALDVAIIGSNGVSAIHGATCPTEMVAAMKSAAIKASRESILVSISPRWGLNAFIRFAELSDFQIAITDMGIDPVTEAEVRTAGLRLIKAE
jgi:DeoR family fructose operon transcriptional repressor